MTSHPAAVSEPSGFGVVSSGDTDLDYDALLESIQSGRFGGVPHLGPGPIALIEVLRRRRWRVDARTFANALPHHSEEFGSNEIRATLARLGLVTKAIRVPGRRLPALPEGSMVLNGRAIRFVSEHVAEGMRLKDPASGDLARIRLRRRYECLAVEPGPQGPAAPRTGNFAFSLWHRFRPELQTVLLLTLLSNALVLLASFSIYFIFDVVLPALALDTLAALMLAGVSLIALDLRLRKIKSRIVAHVSGRLEYIVSGTLYAKLLDLPLEKMTSVSIGDQMSRLKQFETVRDVFCGPIVTIAFELPFIAIMIGTICFINPTVGLVVLAAVGAHVALGFWSYPRMKHATRDLSNCQADYTRVLEETVSHRAEIVRRGLGRTWRHRLAPRHARVAEARRRVDTLVRFLTNVNAVALPLALGCVTAVGAVKVVGGEMTGGALIACTILVSRLLGPVQQGLLVAVRLPAVANLFRQMSAMLMLPSANRAGSGQHFSRATSRIKLENVVLRYPRTVEPALRDVTLTVESGAFICVGGPSGAGKSSLLRAIIGHYRLQMGGIYLGRVNADQLTNQERTQTIGHLGHRTLQIHGTVKQNLRLTAPGATDAELRAVCDEVGLLRTIEALPGGFDHRLDHASRAQFSGTFWTALALAQLLLRRPQILLLDEPEAGLTPEDETTLLRTIEKRRGQTTILMVTHRPSTMRRADKVLILQSGRVRFFGLPEKMGM